MLCRAWLWYAKSSIHLSVNDTGEHSFKFFENNLQESWPITFDTGWQRGTNLIQGDHPYIPGGIKVSYGKTTPQGCRDRERPKNTWKRTVEKELGNMKLSWSEAESKAQDRAKWRSIVGSLCSCRSWKAKKKKNGKTGFWQEKFEISLKESIIKTYVKCLYKVAAQCILILLLINR